MYKIPFFTYAMIENRVLYVVKSLSTGEVLYISRTKEGADEANRYIQGEIETVIAKYPDYSFIRAMAKESE